MKGWLKKLESLFFNLCGFVIFVKVLLNRYATLFVQVSLPLYLKVNRGFRMSCKNFLSPVSIQTIWQILQSGVSRRWVQLFLIYSYNKWFPFHETWPPILYSKYICMCWLSCDYQIYSHQIDTTRSVRDTN